MCSITALTLCLSPAGWEADQYSRGVPECSAEKAQRHLWEVRMHAVCTHIHGNTEASRLCFYSFFYFIYLFFTQTSAEKRKILRRRWTRKGKRKSTRPNLKTRMWQKSKCLFELIGLNNCRFGFGCYACLTTRCHCLLNIYFNSDCLLDSNPPHREKLEINRSFVNEVVQYIKRVSSDCLTELLQCWQPIVLFLFIWEDIFKICIDFMA